MLELVSRRRSNGAGALRRLASGRFQALVPDPRFGTYRSLGTFRTKGEAERALQDAQVDRRRGAFVPPDRSNVRLDEYVERWFRTKVIRPATEANYRVMLDTHVLPDLGHLPLGRIDRETVETWLADVHRRANRRTGRPLAPSTVAKAYKVLNTVMRGAVEHGYVVRNPCDVKGGGREPVNERRAPTPAEVIELADAVPARYRALVLLAGFGALRWAEAAGLRKHRVDLLHRTVRVEEQATEPVPGRHEVGRPKTDAGIRDIALPDLVIKALEEHLGRWAEPGPAGTGLPRARRRLPAAGLVPQDRLAAGLSGHRRRGPLPRPAPRRRHPGRPDGGPHGRHAA